jgi:hypothetical protein
MVACAPLSTSLSTPGVADAPTREPAQLTNQQQDAINQAAQKLLAENEQQAIQIAHELHFAEGEEDPSNMCGPLALFILREAGIVSPTVNPHSFWLLNPRINRKIIAQVFPENEFIDRRVETPLNQFNFQEFPLRVGDFLYLYAGKGGSFEHMLVVTRVDETGRAFSVTNYAVAPKSFVIQEVLLYDPAQPGTGKFYDWTNRKNEKLGLTGLGGFEVWRRKTPIPTP